MKIPRKIKKKIPKGLYCYEPISYDKKTMSLNISTCPFYKFIKLKDKPLDKQDEIDKEHPEEFTGWCKLIKYEIDDQCKSCNIKKF
jgi:hypothetical protein